MEEIQRQLEEIRILKIQGPQGYGYANLVESGQVGSGPVNGNLIEAARTDWIAGNPDIVCYNCETPGNYESRCWKPSWEIVQNLQSSGALMVGFLMNR